jgi:hypothetical protein
MAVAGAVLAVVIGVMQSQPNGAPAPHAPTQPRHGDGTRPDPREPGVVPGTSRSAIVSGSASSVAACAPADLTITTTTDHASYARGARITTETELVSDKTCELGLVPSGPYTCPESLVVDAWSGEQVFPAQGQTEQCGDLPGGLVVRGTSEVETVVWDQTTVLRSGRTGRAAPGRYVAIGSWSWNSGNPAAPYEVAADSPAFELLP